MRILKPLRAAMAALLILTLCALGLPSAFAASADDGAVKDELCSLTVEFILNGEPVTDTRFSAWRVGELTDRGWVPLEPFLGYNVLQGEGSWSDKASTLLGYLERDDVEPDASAITDGNGRAKFDQLEQGMYLVSGEEGTMGNTRYTPTPFLITLPHANESGSLEYEVKTVVKFNSYETPGPDHNTVNRHVLKTWNDEGHKEERPHEVTVDLLRNGKVYDTVTLTAEKNWRHDWIGLDAGNKWTVVEREDGKYAVLVEQKGITFKITNTWQDDIDPDDPPPLIDNPDPDPTPPPDEPTPTPTPPPDEPTPTPTPPETDIPDDPPPLDQTEIPDDPPPLDATDPPQLPQPPAPIEVPDNDPPLVDDPMLPQTGQLWWPVAPMVLLGLTLTAVGWKRNRDWCALVDDSDEA